MLRCTWPIIVDPQLHIGDRDQHEPDEILRLVHPGFEADRRGICLRQDITKDEQNNKSPFRIGASYQVEGIKTVLFTDSQADMKRAIRDDESPHGVIKTCKASVGYYKNVLTDMVTRGLGHGR